MTIKPKKSLSQNFLIDRDVLNKIVETVNINEKTILEIGPGSGNLTSYIHKKKPKSKKTSTMIADRRIRVRTNWVQCGIR